MVFASRFRSAGQVHAHLRQGRVGTEGFAYYLAQPALKTFVVQDLTDSVARFFRKVAWNKKSQVEFFNQNRPGQCSSILPIKRRAVGRWAI